MRAQPAIARRYASVATEARGKFVGPCPPRRRAGWRRGCARWRHSRGQSRHATGRASTSRYHPRRCPPPHPASTAAWPRPSRGRTGTPRSRASRSRWISLSRTGRRGHRATRLRAHVVPGEQSSARASPGAGRGSCPSSVRRSASPTGGDAMACGCSEGPMTEPTSGAAPEQRADADPTRAPRVSQGESPLYKGEPLEAERGPGLGYFWVQVAALGILLVLTPLSVVWAWDERISAVLLIVTLILLLFAGQTVVFLLRLVAADRRGRRAPRSPTARKTVGMLEDEGSGSGPVDVASRDTDPGGNVRDLARRRGRRRGGRRRHRGTRSGQRTQRRRCAEGVSPTSPLPHESGLPAERVEPAAHCHRGLDACITCTGTKPVDRPRPVRLIRQTDTARSCSTSHGPVSNAPRNRRRRHREEPRRDATVRCAQRQR